MHVALAQDAADPLFAPEPFDAGHQQALRASARALADRTFAMLRDRAPALAGEPRALADEILARRAEVDRTLEGIAARRLDAVRIRIHGDYHLGQVLATGADFVIIDFEGEPGRPLAERRHKLGPLRDVAGMVRSLDYAGAAALRGRDGAGRLAPWTGAWSDDAAAAFVAGYLERARGTALLPASPADAATLLDFYLVEKCIYEIGYELNNRPDWLAIPLAGLRRLLGGPP
jgi:maltose alpha-D-glucosyltransferase/alpha-amylase